ncbi:hypothetical protein Q6A58_33400, partial [Pseudomonas aeruginosa]|uniref:hypothetical protein n=1 Tax=Pseudomonas aeruginosa TaxID=287 RepID=UPI002713C6FD
MLKDPFAMPSRSPSSARSSRALSAPRLKPLAQAIALLLVAGGRPGRRAAVQRRLVRRQGRGARRR